MSKPYQLLTPAYKAGFRASAPTPQPGRPYTPSERWAMLPAWVRGPIIGLGGGLATAGLLIALMP